QRLRGDRLTLDLGSETEARRGAVVLDALDGVFDILVEGHLLHAHAAEGGRALPTVLQALDRAGLTAGQVSVSRPSLDDIYLMVTGRTFARAADEPTPRRREEVPAGGRPGRASLHPICWTLGRGREPWASSPIPCT